MNRGPNQNVARREILAGLGTGLSLSVAGCLGGDNSGTVATTASEMLPPPTLGADDAPIPVAVYKDFACPHCATFTEDIESKLVNEYVGDGVVKLQHYDFPIPVKEPVSYEAANAARAVQDDADDEAFFAYADRLFENQSSLGPETYANLAEAVDGTTVREAADGRVYRKTITEDFQTGQKRGVGATPTVFVGDTKLDNLRWKNFQSVIEDKRNGSSQ